ncbi:MAG: M20/M25/M40 family metallo-hydrolase [Bacteroidales bacterium]|nr:M20/M25/M40 family metallo-hydrolase [Bacteroidales bacterium]
MKKILIVATAILSLCLGSASAQRDPVIDRIIEIGQNDNRTMQHLDVLSNRIGGRLIGSDGYATAEKWAAQKFREWGMEVIIEEVGTLPVGFNRGPWFGRMLSDNGMTLHFATPSYTVGTKGVQIGHVMLEPKSRTEFERMKGKLNGAWVLISGKSDGWPIDISEEADKRRAEIIAENEETDRKNNEIRRENRANRNTNIPPKELLPLKEEPALFYKEMVEAGILGIVQSASNPIVALYDRKNHMNFTFDDLPKVPDIKLDEHQFAVIEQMAKERQRFFLEFDIRNHFRMGPIPYHNVIGVIPGTEFPDEYVIMGGHLDAFDVATGGVDNGSGVTPAMEAARLIMEAGGKPKRTILVCLWTGEEFGLLGSRHWVENHADKLDKVSNMFNRDGGPTVASSLSVTAAMMDDIVKVCEPLNDINPDFPFTVTERPPMERPKVAWGTDSGPFAVAGVPTLSFGTTDPKGYDFNYREIWHTERDLYNMSIPEYQEHTSIVTAIVVYGIANLDHLLSREGYWKEEQPEPDNTSRRRRR